MNSVNRQLHRAVRRRGGGLGDAELLESFLTRQDEAAFGALVRRHGPMVLGVCRWVLGHAQDAEDAFQATFLVLARKAGSLGQRDLVGNWLYGVAYRTAREAKARNARRRAREKQVKDLPHPAVEPELAGPELSPTLDRELSRLPDKYRAPVVLCDLEGGSRKEVARQLNLPEGTLSSRLAAARRMLALRLARHGWAAPCAVARAAVPPPLAANVSAQAAALTEGVLQAMLLTKPKLAAVVLALGLLGAGVG